MVECETAIGGVHMGLDIMDAALPMTIAKFLQSSLKATGSSSQFVPPILSILSSFQALQKAKCDF